MVMHYPSSGRITHPLTKLKLFQTDILNMKISSLHSNDLSRAPLGCGETSDLLHECATDKSAPSIAVMSVWTKIQCLVESK